MATESPKSQGVPIDQRCWDCGYDLRGLEAGAVCPECGADRGEQIKRRRATFVRESRPWVVLGIVVTVACWGALGMLFGRASGSERRVWNVVLPSLPLINVLIGLVFLARCDREFQRVVGMILIRAACWANVPLVMGAMVLRMPGMFLTALPIAGVTALVCCVLFVVRWGMLADRAYLPARGRLGGVQTVTVVTIFITGMWPAWLVVLSRLMP